MHNWIELHFRVHFNYIFSNTATIAHPTDKCVHSDQNWIFNMPYINYKTVNLGRVIYCRSKCAEFGHVPTDQLFVAIGGIIKELCHLKVNSV